MADLPIAAIVCIAVGLYLLVMIGVILLCYCLKGRGRCSGESNCCAKKEGAQSCECCLALAEACNCCKGPSLNSCLKSCCPDKKISCLDIIMCQCCASDGTTLCDSLCCRSCRRDSPETCNCLCLEIRLRSTQHSTDDQSKLPPSTSAAKVKQAWMADRPALFHGIPMLPDMPGADGYRIWNNNDPKDLQLDLGWFRSPAAFPVSTHPIDTNRSETSGDFVPTSTPRFHQGRTQLFIRPGVHSAGRVIAKRQLGHQGSWSPPIGRRWSSKRRSSRRVRSPVHTQQQQQRAGHRRRSSLRAGGGVRAASRRHSHRERGMPLSHQGEEEGEEDGYYDNVRDRKRESRHFVRE